MTFRDIKKNFYQQIGKMAPQKTIFASNTSTFVPNQLAPFTDREEKFLNIHFANHIWLLNIAEIMGTKETSSTIYQTVVEFAKAIGMVPIKLKKEQPGYVLNSLLIPFLTSALQLWITGIASPQEIDKDWMIANKAPAGPFMTLDMLGLRTVWQIIMNIYNTTKDESNLLIANKLKEMIEEGHTGQESGQGFYKYPNPEYTNSNFLKA